MARCFLTGVEFRVEDGYVLNRGDAYRLLRTLRNRCESLERLIAQLSPRDEPTAERRAGTATRARKQHRMICKAVADALGQAYAEVRLFLPWPAFLSRNVIERMRILKEHPLYGASLAAMPEDDLVQVADLGRAVLRLIDPKRELPLDVQNALKLGICVRHRETCAADIATSIRSVIFENGDLTSLGVPAPEHEAVRSSLAFSLCAPSVKARADGCE